MWVFFQTWWYTKFMIKRVGCLESPHAHITTSPPEKFSTQIASCPPSPVTCSQIRNHNSVSTLYSVDSMLWCWVWSPLWRVGMWEMFISCYKSWLLLMLVEGWSTEANRRWTMGTPHLRYVYSRSDIRRQWEKTASHDRGHHQGKEKAGNCNNTPYTCLINTLISVHTL